MKKKLTSSICSNCRGEEELFSGVRFGQLYENLCESCVGHLGSSEFYRRWDRQSQRRTHARDIVQPGDPDYVRAYGPDKAREAGWSEDQIRRA